MRIEECRRDSRIKEKSSTEIENSNMYVSKLEILPCHYVTVHAKTRHKSAKIFFEISPDSAFSTLLPCSFKIWCG